MFVDPLAEETFEPYLYTGNNPIMFTDPTGMSKEDWVYNKEEDSYHWDNKVTKASDVTDSNLEYVGKTIDDVNTHHEKNNPIMSYVTDPQYGESKNGSWPGELREHKVTATAKWAKSENIVAKITYGMVNDPWIAIQSVNPFQSREGITSIAGWGVNPIERQDAGISTISSLMPLGRMTKGAEPLLNTMNAAQFGSKFKGTILTQTSHARRGMYNRSINSGIRGINKKYGSFREPVKSNTEMFAPIFRDDRNKRRKK